MKDWTETGDFGADNERGEELALQCIARVRNTGQRNYLGVVVKGMIERGHFGGVEVGFFHVISLAVL